MTDYEHKQMLSSIIIRCFPQLVEDLDTLLKNNPGRFENRSQAARAAIIYALNQRTFVEKTSDDGL